MSTWQESLTSQVMTLLDAVRALPAEPWRVSVMRWIASCANELSRSGEPPTETIDAALRGAGRDGAGLSSAGRVPPELVEAIGATLNLLLARPTAAKLLGFGGSPAPEAGVLRASGDRPVSHVVEREPYLGALPEEGAHSAKDEVEESDEADETDDDAGGPPTPRDLAAVEPFVPHSSAPPPVVLDEGGEPIPLGRFYDEVARSSLDWIALLSRHRFERRVNERAREEARLLTLADAFAASAHDCVGTALRWWEEHVDSPDPWKAWAIAFALGTLDGDDIPPAIVHALERLPPHAFRHAEVAAQGLSVCPHAGLVPLAEDLSRSAHPVARGVGVDLLSRYQKLSPEELAKHLCDPNPPVLLAAMRGLLRLPRPLPPALLSTLAAWMSYPRPSIAWAATRALAVAGVADPYYRAKSDPGFATLLGPNLVELLVLFGDMSDVPLIEAVTRKGPVTPGLLDAIARFGCPKVWAFLVHYLGDADMAGDAADALELLFGERVARPLRLKPHAWRDAIRSAKLSPELRYRHGQPWQPSAIIDEYGRGMIDTSALLGRADEVIVRARLNDMLDLSAWLPEASPRLDAFFGAVSRADGRLAAGGWECATLQGTPGAGLIFPVASA